MITHLKNIRTLQTVFFLTIAVFISTGAGALKAYAQNEALTISDVEVVNINDTKHTAEVVWNTNLYSQSWVVCGNYSRAPFDFSLGKMTFGYTWGTILIPDLSIEHTVPLTELTPGAHYCRVASRTHVGGPWAVSDEIAFTVDDKNAPPEGKLDAVSGTTNEQGPEGESVGENTEVGTVDENENTGSLGAFLKNQGSDSCRNEWGIWLLVLLALLSLSFWSKEMRSNLTSESVVKRLYILSGAGVFVFLIVILNDAETWVVPIGIGTIAVIIATITDVIRSVDGVEADKRLIRVIRSLYITLWVALLFAFILGWTCSIAAIIITALILMYREKMVKNEE